MRTYRAGSTVLALGCLVASAQALAQAAGSISISTSVPGAFATLPAGRSLPLPPTPTLFVHPGAGVIKPVGSFAPASAERAGISWQPFSIGKSDFGRPPTLAAPAAAALNRVASPAAQQIGGLLQQSAPQAVTVMSTGIALQLSQPPTARIATQALQTPDGRIVFRATPQ